ncbi:ankyrin repeat-containing domain protein [Mycena leptocephala]|nr:ankyrin repeat-containing domain protein [Mycena leptocephala]
MLKGCCNGRSIDKQGLDRTKRVIGQVGGVDPGVDCPRVRKGGRRLRSGVWGDRVTSKGDPSAITQMLESLGYQAEAWKGGNEANHDILLDKGANINAAGGRYGSSLQAATQGGHTEIVCILLDKGADVNAAGGYGRRIWELLASCHLRGHTEIVYILLDKGADVNAAGRRYGSSLQAATEGGHTEIVCILDKGTDVNPAGGRYGSSLQAATQGGHTEIVCILLDKGADINASGGGYKSSLQTPTQGCHTGIVHMLMEWGARVRALVEK